MKTTRSLPLLPAFILLVSILISSCVDDETPTGPDTSAPVLRAIGTSAGLVVTWERAPAATRSYVLEVGQAGVVTPRVFAPARRGALIGGIAASSISLTLRDGSLDSATNTVSGTVLGSATWSAADTLGAPTSVSLARVDQQTVRLSWRRSSDAGVSGYVILRERAGVLTVQTAAATDTALTLSGFDATAERVFVASTDGERHSLGLAATLPVDPGTQAPQNLRASSLDGNAVLLTWDAMTGIDRYRVSWNGAAGGSLETTTNRATIGNLTAGVVTTFTVVGLPAGGGATVPSSVDWSPALRFTTFKGGTPIRMYESASVNPSGLAIDATGVTPVGLSPTSPGRAQLAMYVDPPNGGSAQSVIVGPVFGIVAYRVSLDNPAKYDSSVYISATTYTVSSLDEWYLSHPLDQVIAPNSNVMSYSFPASMLSSSQGFVVRMGQPGSYRYARVFIKSDGGSMLKGTRPNRYIELEISFQGVVNVPFA